MVKHHTRNSTRPSINKEKKERQVSARKIRASTPHETCKEALSAFGGLLDFLDEARRKAKAWLNGNWQCRFSLNTC